VHVSIAILGSDALLAAQPATPVQLMHAARAAGFDAVLPVSLGDELVAEEALRLAQAKGRAPVLLCACPQLPGDSCEGALGSMAIAVAPPAVALARALRLDAEGGALHLTYVGDCPGAVDPAIDLRVPPDAFLRGLAKRGIDPRAQPTEFTDRLPPDRRRFHSLPGGAPAAERCAALLRRALVVPAPRAGSDPRLLLADALLAGGATFVDPGPLFGCACAGAARALAAVTGDATAAAAPVLHAIEGRARLAALEPPRAPSPVIAADARLDLRPTRQLVADGVRAERPVTPPSVLAAQPTPDVDTAPRPMRPAAPALAEPTSARARFALARRARQRHLAPGAASPSPSPAPIDAGALQAPVLEREVPLVTHDEPSATARESVTGFFAGVLREPFAD
jgi:hypothetical protein